MALIYWMPMTDGTLKNQGLSGESFTSTNFSAQDNGKLGKCIKTNNNTIESGMTETNWIGQNGCTICGWFKFPESEIASQINSVSSSNTTPTGCLVGWCAYAGIGLVWTSLKPYNNVFSVVISVRENNNLYAYGTDLKAKNLMDEWVHVCGVVDYREMKEYLYLNGVIVMTRDIPNINKENVPKHPLTMNMQSVYGGNGPGLSIPYYCNDIRVYDSPLSAKEINLISKGLTCHYPLNRDGFGCDNLLNTLNHQNYHNSNSSAAYPMSRSFHTDEAIEYERIVRTSYDKNPTVFSIYGLCNKTAIDTSISVGETVTLTVWARCSHDISTTYLTFTQIKDNSNYTNDRSVVTPMVANRWTKFTLTTTIGYSYSELAEGARAYDISIYGITIPTGEIENFYFDFRQDYKLEVGEKSTPWIPHSSNSLYSAMGLDNNIVYDTSGYQNNGELYTTNGTGEFIWESDTPKYNVSCHIHSLNSTTNAWAGTAYIRANCGLVEPEQLTIAFWCYARAEGYGGNTNQGVFCTTNNTGDATGSDYQTSAMNHRDTSVNINRITDTSQLLLGMTFTADEWHHYAFTYDGQYARSYKDGALFDTKSFSDPVALNSFSSVVLGLSRAGGVWRRNNNNYSDLRVYATCLSADDISALYNTSASLTSSGVLFSNEIQEV